MPGFQRNVAHLRASELARASVLSRPDRQLDGNIQYLEAVMAAAEMGEAIMLRDVTVEAEVLVGQPVFYNSVSQRYERALAAVTYDVRTGGLVPAASSDVVGLIHSKTSATLATLLVLGSTTLSIANAVTGTVTPGRYYLSASQPGMLVAQQPPISVAVLRVLEADRVLVSPDLREFLDSHTHLKFVISCYPAGTVTTPSPGGTHTITDADASLPGWLPADHASFGGLAPSGAAFGYNIAVDSDLQRWWPPIPPEACVLELYSPGTDVLTGGRVPDGLVLFDTNGIWWMSDYYGQVPWPLDYSGSESSDVPGGQEAKNPELVLSFARSTFGANGTAVTSLESDTPLIQLTGCSGEAASTGRLRMDLNLGLTQVDANSAGSLVLKAFDTTLQQFQRGYVAEGLLAGNYVTLTSSHSQTVANVGLVHQGIVQVDVEIDPAGRELPFELIKLVDARERYVGNLMYLSLLPAQITGFTTQVSVPLQGLPASPHVVLRFVILGTTAGAPGDVTVTYTRLPRPGAATALPSTVTTITLPVSDIGTISSGNYFEIDSPAIAVAAGDTLFIAVTRGASDGYAGELGFLRRGAVLQAGA